MSATTPEKCPKCESSKQPCLAAVVIQFECGSMADAINGKWLDETHDCIKRQRDQLADRVRVFEATLSDPAAVWANMLRGTIAMPPHIPELEGRLTDAHVRIQIIETALDLVVPTCEHLHHEKKYRHLAHEPCPVREIVMKAKGLK